MAALWNRQAIIFSSCGFFFYSSLILRRRRLDVYHSSLVHVADVSGRPALRSAGSNRLRIAPLKLSTIGGRAFPIAAAQFWNRLSDNVTSANSLSAFRQQLKHTLFQQ